jgi:diacylglycerol kinase family enzyme
MYYYIFDLKKCRKNSQVTDIKNYLSALGISGEFTYPSAAYTTEELVELGLSKKYNTIVGIGGDEIANKIASRLCGKPEAMGIIPLEASEDLMSLIGCNSWKEGAESLRYRKILEMRIGQTANGSAFLTNLSLDIKSPTDVTLEFRDYMVQTRAAKMLVSNYHPDIDKIGEDHLDIVLHSVGPKPKGFLSQVSAIFGGNKEDEQYSLFRARSFRLFTNSQVPLICGDQIVAKTPQLIESSDEDLRLIVGKKRVSKELK